MPTQDKKQIQVSQLSLPKGGGAIQGMGETFQANEFSGTANLSIPLFASPCRDFTPELSLTYSSGEGNGPWGMGFSMSLPQISRQTRKGTPRYENNDIFVLSGSSDLVPLDQAPRTQEIESVVYTIQTFAPREEGLFVLIEYWQPANPSKAFWKVTDRNHTISIFGKTPQARITDPANPNHIFTWLLEESYNTTGDHHLFVYKQEDTVNVPDVIYERGHVVTANRYIERVLYGNEKPVRGSILLNASADPGLWHFEVVFDYGEYLVDSGNTSLYKPHNDWSYRPDPFSSYRAGFEIRTYRRCLHTLMFHRFKVEFGDDPVLIHATAYDYQTNRGSLSQCISITDTGYFFDKNKKTYTTASLPPLSLSYTPFQPEGHEFVPLTTQQREGLSGLNEAPHYNLVDLFGEGAPGILYNDKTAYYYREVLLANVSATVSTSPQPLRGASLGQAEVCYGEWNVLETFPSQRDLEAEHVLLQDLTGDGQLDIVLSKPGIQGYWESQADHTWKPFRSLPSWPADFPAPGQTWVDVTGDGIPDLVQLTEKEVVVYRNARTHGITNPLIRPARPDMPSSLIASPVEVLHFTDIAGSGQAHLARIRNREVVYWPNLSYCCFGDPVTMSNAPDFGPDFNPAQLFLADLDGSGTTDLIYVQNNSATIWLNTSGNSFADPITLSLPAPFDNFNQISFADIYGRGNECMVICEPHAIPHPRYWCYDFCQRQKPYMLCSSENNMGAKTEITYGSSMDFYLTDKQVGLPWITPLPFPVQVITQITHTDLIVGSRYVSQYAYHHGYYDGIEREFRGFGRVDRQDAEYFPSGQVNSEQNPEYVAPSLSRTWYHTGAYIEDAALSRQYAEEYYAGDKQAFAFPDSMIDWGSVVPDGATIRQAYVAMTGTELRSEIYGLDDSPQSKHPYSIREFNFLLQLRQARGTNPYAIFYVHTQQELTYSYERNPDDPQIHQSCVLQIDAYGSVERSCAIAYPRRNVAEALSEQQRLRVTCATQSYVNQTDPETYLLDVTVESQSYEITTLTAVAGMMFSYNDLKKNIGEALATVSSTSPSSDQAKLLSWEKSIYLQVDENGTNTLLPFGQIALPLFLGEHRVAEFSHAQAASALSGALEGDALKQKLIDGCYLFDDASGYWWNYGMRPQYKGLAEFYHGSATIDPMGNMTKYAYDGHHMFLTKVTDALDNCIQIREIDYQHLHPMQLVDPNDNVSEVKLDALGRVIYTSYYGHEAGKPVGFLPVSEAPVAIPDSLQSVVNDPAGYLGGVQSFFFYDAFAWMKWQTPVGSIGLVAEQYPKAPVANRIQVHLSYHDGLGRSLCSKSKVEPGEAFLYDAKTKEITMGTTEDRWLTSGSVVYNNKGNPVREYEPYFINSPDYISNPVIDTFGVSPVLYYDPLDRLTHTITPKGYLLKHAWTAWEQLMSDANDTFLDSPYCQVNVLQPDPKSLYYDLALSEADRISLAAAIRDPAVPNPPRPSTDLGRTLLHVINYFVNTPERSVIDNLGHVLINERINKSQNNPQGEILRDFYTYDIQGRQLTSVDPRLHDANLYNFQNTYSLTGAVLKVVSADAGTRWALTNILGNPLWSYNERQITITPGYDVLHRPIKVHVYKPATDKDPLVLDQIVQRFIYGDTIGAIDKPKDNNLIGRVYKYYDQAGLVTVPSYGLTGASLSSQRQLRIDYNQEADWTNDDSATINSKLQPAVYTEQSSYDALGRVTQHVDVDGNKTIPVYHFSGLLNQVVLTTADDQQTKQVVQGITYNAKGQRLSVSYGNNTISAYTYDSKTWAMTRLRTVNTQKKILQDLLYEYDPVGNVTAKTDDAQDTVYYNNQKVNPTATYVYDSLYRLIEGTGREKIGNGNADQEMSLPSIQPHANDDVALQNYIEKYTYDRGNNLVQTKHIAQQDSWTRTMILSNKSNRGVISTIDNNSNVPGPDEVDRYFDAHGNQIQTQQVYPLTWNYRDNLQQATIIKHADGTCDAEYYVYDGGGQRVRKVSEQYGHSGQAVTFKETLYLGNVNYRRTLHGNDLSTAVVQEEYHSLRVMDDEQCVTTRDHWTVGAPPVGFQNPNWRYHLNDHLGSCTIEADEQGQQISYEEYSPYGDSTVFIGTGSASQLKQYRHSGKERDSVTGFYYYGARYFAPWLGRWLSTDPAGTIDGLNVYAFVRGNPTSFFDMYGMEGKGKKRKSDGDDSGHDTKRAKVAAPISKSSGVKQEGGSKQWVANPAPNMNSVEDYPIPDTVDSVHQSNLAGNSKAAGKKNFGVKLQEETFNNSKRQVYASLKINSGGKEYTSKNGKAGENIEFCGMGTTNQGGPKKNPHAEDWIFAEFYNDVKERGGQTLNKFMEKTFGPKKHNTARPKQHCLTLSINFSPCTGCVASILKFKEFLHEGLNKKVRPGNSMFLLRVEFLRPYALPKNLATNDSDMAKYFETSIKNLKANHIPVQLMNWNPDDDEFGRGHILELFPSPSIQAIATPFPDQDAAQFELEAA